MRNTSFLFPWLSLFFLINLFGLDTKAASTPKVLDITKKPLRSGVNYYILPVIRGRGGGLTLASASKNKPCPLNQIVQDRFEVNNGLPLTFTPVNTTKPGLVRESVDLNIKFSAATICIQSTVWKLGTYDESKKVYFLTTGGVEGNPGRETTSNWFKIEKFGDDYKLVFCPTVCNYCKVICKDVGIYIEKDGKRRLALSFDDKPFAVMFKKA